MNRLKKDSPQQGPASALDSTVDVDTEYWGGSLRCKVCGEQSTGEPTAYLCARCRKVLGPKNLTSQIKRARFGHMRKQWERNGEFRCSYTGVRLELEDRNHVRYREWEHATPDDEDSVVLATALVNRMKCYLNAEEFEDMVAELARYFIHPESPFAETAFPTHPVPRSAQA